jgi:uncharacterized protein (TIGR02996 family)
VPTDRDALLAAICAHPDEDTPRLAFADWCDENGDPERAEFIRLQFEAERHAEHSPARMDIDGRAAALLERNRAAWIAGAPEWALDPEWPPEVRHFRRGFLHQIAAKAEDLLASPEALFSAAPVREAEVRLIREGGVALAASPILGRLAKVELSFAETPTDLPAFLASPHLGGLAELSLKLVGPEHSGAPFWKTLRMLDDAGAVALAGCPHLSRLRALDVGVGEIGPRGVAALARSPHLASVEKLDIRSNPIGDDGADELARSGIVPRLAELDLSGTDIGDRGLGALLAASPGRLRRISFGQYSNCPITDAGVQAFADCEALAALEVLEMSYWPLTRRRARAIARSPHLAGVRVLELCGCELDDDMVVELARSPYMRNLRFINAPNDRVGTRGFTALVRSPAFGTVTELVLYNNPEIGDAGITALAESEYAGELRRACLVTVGCGLDGVRALASSPRLGQLRDLDVQSTPFGDEGARLLCESPYLTRITRLAVYNCGIGADMTAALRKRFGAALKI